MGEEITEKYYVRRREFLNRDPDLPAFIIGIVEDTRAIPDDDRDSWNGGTVILDLADCYRRVKFDFALYDEDERANSLRKITLLAEVVNAVREGIAMEVESRNARDAKLASMTTETAQAEPEHAKEAVAGSPFTSHFTTLGL